MIRPLQPGDADACAALLARLPDWFGIPEANAAYIESLRRLPGFVAIDDGRLTGFVAVEQHFTHAAEITVIGLTPLYESLTEFGSENAALILVKQRPAPAGAPSAGGNGG